MTRAVQFSMAVSFNEYFASVFTDDDGTLPNIVSPFNRPSITDFVIIEQGDFNLLLNLNLKKKPLARCYPE